MTQQAIRKTASQSAVSGKNLFKPHPWHGLSLYTDSEEEVQAFIEIVPADAVKYEIDKNSGYLKLDRPQKYSNKLPCLYGFLPQTFSGDVIAEYTRQLLQRTDLVGDRDPVDICVLTETAITHGNIILNAVPVGGFRMIDHGEVDDKIIAVLRDDPVYGHMKDISECPEKVIDRIRHYFSTYKEIPADANGPGKCQIVGTYGRDEAFRVIDLCHQDYIRTYR
ncbi:MAG: inorganic pyrophosphatase [Deltaproteobacteria bacterium]|nr:inorganic pyrophosphatase [Deltaproteobacteria bacterium]